MDQPLGFEREEALREYAVILDEAATEPNTFLIALAVRKALGYAHLEDLDEETSPLVLATAWIFEYHVETKDATGRRRLKLTARHDFGGRVSPPLPREAPAEVKGAWSQLVTLATSAKVRARLYLILWEIGGPTTPALANQAISALLEASEQSTELEKIHNLAIVTRISRAMSYQGAFTQALDNCLQIAADELENGLRRAGIVLRALDHVVGEREAPRRVDELLETAATTLDDVKSRDQALELVLLRCGDEACKQIVWRRRVDTFLGQAASEDNGLLRSARLQEALRIAEESNNADLRERASAALQLARNEDLEMIRTEASTRLYEAEFEAFRDQFISGESWQEALVSCARTAPLSGNVDKNREFVRTMLNDHPLASLMPAQLMGPDGLPYFRATTPEEKFEFELVKHEATRIGYSVAALTAALHEIAVRFTVPSISDLAAFLSRWPGIESLTAIAMAKSFHRFWAGDGEAAASSLMPHIEAQVRELVLASNRGVYRLQQKNSPGQFAGLGVLIPILAEEYLIDESRERFLGALLTKPSGYNLRNYWCHGIHRDLGPGAAALLIHSILLIGLLERRSNLERSGSEPQ